MNDHVQAAPGASPRFQLHDFAPEQQSFAEALVIGLSRPQKAIPPRFLYDEAGSRLFDRICELPEYYPTRTEVSILADKADEIAEAIGSDVALLEFGAGSSRKARLLLDALERPAAYEPIDVSREHLVALAEEVAGRYPRLQVNALCADYTQPLELPDLQPRRRRTGFFPGSTIGNLDPADARRFLATWAGQLGHDGLMVVGVDMKKDPAVLLPAYDDPSGLTAAFSLNILARANRELGADFDLDAFRHTVSYDERTGRLSIHLTSLAAQTVGLQGRAFRFEGGERMHVEDSNKYAPEDFCTLARSAGYAPEALWIDADALFSVHMLRVE